MNVKTKEKSPPGLVSESGSPLAFASGAIASGKANCTTDCSTSQATTSCTDKFTAKRPKVNFLADCYETLGQENKALRVRNCGTSLIFGQNVMPGLELGDPHLVWARFCRDRLCPMCSWRKSVKMFRNLSRIIQVTGTEYEYLFLTLTVRNCSAADLQKSIDLLLKGSRLLFRYKEVSAITCGWTRTLEITHRINNPPEIAYHPHLHFLVAVPRSYTKSRHYLKQERWVELWQRACSLDYAPSVRVQMVRNLYGKACETDSDLLKAVKEVAKYSVKDSDYLRPDKKKWSCDSVETLSAALKGRRLFALGGVFKDVAAQLDLADPEDSGADLTDCDRLNPLGEWLVTNYSWHGTGYVQTTHEILTHEQRTKLKQKGN